MYVVPSRIKRIPRKTETAGTVIDQLVGQDMNQFERTGIYRLNILEGATAHTLSVMRKLSESPALAAVLSSAAVIHVAVDLGVAAGLNAMAAGDYIVYETINKQWKLGKVQSVSGSAPDFTVTLTANVSDGIPQGGRILYLGLPADGHEQHLLTARVENELMAEPAYFFADDFGEPIVISINNATNAAIISGGIEVGLAM